MPRFALLFVLIALLATPACTGDSGSALQGIYRATTWTRNDTACDTLGPSVLTQQAEITFYVKQETFFGAEFLNVNFCADVNDCTMLAGDNSTIYVGRFQFDRGNDTDGWTSAYYSGVPTNNVCDGDFLETTLLSPAEGVVRIDQVATPAGGFAPDQDGLCTDEAGQAAAQGQPCGSLEVITANLVATLP